MRDELGNAGEKVQMLDAGSFTPVVLEGQGRIAVEFMSYGCGYCRAIEPFLQQVAGMIEDDETIYRVNVTADPELAGTYGISGTPTFVMFLNGQEVGRAEGPDPDLPSVTRAVTGPFLA